MEKMILIMKIILIGFMSSGKSTIGKILADSLNFKFYDIDDIFEERYKISINDFFEKFGEPKFRELEHLLLKQTLEEDNSVISCGGGTPCFFDNIKLINNNGVSVYLKLNSRILFERLNKTRKKRPLLSGLTYDNLEKYISENLIKREPFYNQAQIIIDIENIQPEDFVKHLKLQFEKNNLILPITKE